MDFDTLFKEEELNIEAKELQVQPVFKSENPEEDKLTTNVESEDLDMGVVE